MMMLHKKQLLAALATVIFGATSASAATIQLGTFGTGTNGGSYSYVAGLLSGTTTGDFSFDAAAVSNLAAPAGTFSNATLTVSAAATGAAVTGFGQAFQGMNGFFEVRDSLSNLLLRADFTGGTLSGVLDTNAVSLDVFTQAGGTVTYTSSVFNTAGLINPKTITFDLNPISANVALNGSNFVDFSGPDTANFSATFQPVPEPVSTILLGMGLLGAGVAARRRR